MKKTVLFAMLCVAAVACDKKQDVTPNAKIQSTNVPYRQMTTVPTAGEDLKVSLVEVNDSRCPSNVVCVQMGSADVKFNVADAAAETDVKVSFRPDKKGAEQAFTLSGVNYVLRVSEVLPYPETSKSPNLEDYRVKVSIEKK